MTWTDIPDADIDVGSWLREDIVWARLRDNQRELRYSIFPWIFAEASTTSLSYVALSGAGLFIQVPAFPTYTGLQRKVQVGVDLKVSGGTADYRLRDSASGNTGTAVTGFSLTSYTLTTLSIDIDAAWIGTARFLEIQAKKNVSGTAFAQNLARVSGEFWY